MTPEQKQSRKQKLGALVVSTVIAASGFVSALDYLLKKIEGVANAIEQADMGPDPLEMWRYDVDAKIDSLRAIHRKEQGND
jgi:hypothetical protein